MGWILGGENGYGCEALFRRFLEFRMRTESFGRESYVTLDVSDQTSCWAHNGHALTMIELWQ